MAEKFLKITVSKEMFSEVYVKIDDDDPRFTECYAKNGKFLGAFHLPPLTVQKAAEETLNDSVDWEIEESWVSTHGSKEVDKAEAIQYAVWDATREEVYQANREEEPIQTHPHHGSD